MQHTPPSVSDFEEFKLSWEGDGETRPVWVEFGKWVRASQLNTTKTLPKHLQSVRGWGPWCPYLLCCTWSSCCWSSQRRFSEPRCAPRCLGQRWLAVGHNVRTSLSTRRPGEGRVHHESRHGIFQNLKQGSIIYILAHGEQVYVDLSPRQMGKEPWIWRRPTMLGKNCQALDNFYPWIYVLSFLGWKDPWGLPDKGT